MAVSHRTNRLKLLSQPSVEQLQNGRFRITLQCRPLNPRNDWYEDNKERIFLDYGSLYSDTGSPIIDGIANRSGETYPNMRLINTRSQGADDDYVIELIYETLSDTFVQVKDDTIDYELNGLRRVTRVSIAKEGTDFQKTVGTDFIDHQIDTETAVRCYLASYEIDDTDSYRSVEEVYIQAGTLSKDVRTIGDGVRQTTQQDLVTAPTIAAGNYVISEDIDNFAGLQRFTTSFISKSDGTTLTESDGGEKLAFEYEKLVPFTFPGVVDLVREQNHIFPTVKSPVESIVKADVYTYYQTSNDIVAGDFTKESALGLWNPDEWCQKITTIDAFVSNGRVEPAYFNSQGVRGCRTRSAVEVTGDNGLELNGYKEIYTPEKLELDETSETSNGKPVYRQVFNYVYDVVTRRIDGGSGVTIIKGPYSVKGRATVECKYADLDPDAWQLTVTDVRTDPVVDGGSTGEIFYSQRTGAWSDAYTNAGGTTTTTLATAAAGTENDPSDADWSATDVSLAAASNEEEFTASGYAAADNVGGVTISSAGFWIEGRRVPFGATGRINVSGGPPDPEGKKYTLDVNIKKAFTDKDGTDVFQKQIVIATCTAA